MNPEQQARAALAKRLRYTAKINLVDANQAANEIEDLGRLVDEGRVKHAQELIEGALLGTGYRRGIWTDRDYLVAVCSVLGGGDKARELALAKPVAISQKNKLPRFADQPWWARYNRMADILDTKYSGDAQLAADDIRTLVDGLRDLERKLGLAIGPDPANER